MTLSAFCFSRFVSPLPAALLCWAFTLTPANPAGRARPQVWAIAEGRGAAAAVDRYLAGKAAKNPAGAGEVQGFVKPWSEYAASQKELVA